jgi:Uma2 family endonuclease
MLPLIIDRGGAGRQPRAVAALRARGQGGMIAAEQWSDGALARREKMSKTLVKVGPRDHGRRMSLDDFEHAEVKEGSLYELGRGVIVVSDVPGDRHMALVDYLILQLSLYRGRNPQSVYRIVGGSDCKILVPRLQSERHPDVAVYKKPRPAEDKGRWAHWVPDLVIEVVSQGSEARDYEEKPEEYLEAGVREYWIVDPAKERLTVLTRVKGRWKEKALHPPEVHRTRLLPGFELSCEELFAAGRDLQD